MKKVFLFEMFIIVVILSIFIFVNPDNNFEIMEKSSVIVYGDNSIGSGFFIDSGVVLTASHVVNGNIRVKLCDGTEYNMVEILYEDEFRDFAIFTVDCDSVYVDLCYDYDTGDDIYTYSNPLGIEGVITNGIVSKKDIVIDEKELILFTAPISAGSSGGMLLNNRYEVLGVVLAQLDGYGNNLALSIEDIKELIIKIKKEM